MVCVVWPVAKRLLRRMRPARHRRPDSRRTPASSFRPHRQYRLDCGARDLHRPCLVAAVATRRVGMEGVARDHCVVRRDVGILEEQVTSWSRGARRCRERSVSSGTSVHYRREDTLEVHGDAIRAGSLVRRAHFIGVGAAGDTNDVGEQVARDLPDLYAVAIDPHLCP